jgi:hypothetical protein
VAGSVLPACDQIEYGPSTPPPPALSAPAWMITKWSTTPSGSNRLPSPSASPWSSMSKSDQGKSGSLAARASTASTTSWVTWRALSGWPLLSCIGWPQTVAP